MSNTIPLVKDVTFTGLTRCLLFRGANTIAHYSRFSSIVQQHRSLLLGLLQGQLSGTKQGEPHSAEPYRIAISLSRRVLRFLGPSEMLPIHTGHSPI